MRLLSLSTVFTMKLCHVCVDIALMINMQICFYVLLIHVFVCRIQSINAYHDVEYQTKQRYRFIWVILKLVEDDFVGVVTKLLSVG